MDRVRKIIKINRTNHPWNDLSNEEFYRTAGLFRKDFATGLEGFTMTALLMFGKDESIQSAIPHYKIDALLRILLFIMKPLKRRMPINPMFMDFFFLIHLNLFLKIQI